MPIDWRSSVELFAQMLCQRGVPPDAVSNVDAAWAAFTEFVQTPLDGIVTGEDSDGDGFIVQWGCWSPYVWTKTADEILTNLAAYCKRIKDSGH